MFRDLTRKNKAISREECIELLQSQPRGVLSVLGDEGYPYGIPHNHWYCPEDGKIYFHSGKAGHKIDAINGCNKASFCVYDQGFRKEGEWALNIRSVIVFGRIEIVEDHAWAMEVTRRLSYNFTSDSKYIEEEIEKYGKNTLCFALVPEHITGKLVTES
ncbi:MAG: pyridoxamine 5'-phosphate oxidase family protein [Oscillospiraceae bacterium]|nr:pyridoxamine 5'-phosphate oxidase family protein [Oscillospiraceae bacterium]